MDPNINMKYSKPWHCYFDQCDPAGILFYGQIFFMAHQMLEDFIRHSEISYPDWFHHPQWIVPIKSAQAQYLKPISCGEKINCSLSISKMGSSSLEFETVFINQDLITCAISNVLHVFVDRSVGKKIPIPQEIQLKIKPYLNSNSK